MKLLVRATNWIGDAVISLPAVRAIRAAHEGWEMHVYARPAVAELYEREGVADRVVRIADKGMSKKWQLARALRKERFDRAILLPNSFNSAVPPFLARIPERIGYDRYRRAKLLTVAPKPPLPGEAPKHERFYYLEMLRRAGILAELPACDGIRLECSAQAAEAGRAYWREHGETETRWVGVNPGAANSQAKQWSPEKFAEAAGQVAERIGGKVAVFGAPGDYDTAQEVVERGKGVEFLNLAGKTSAAEFLDLTAACEVILTNDSGGMHVASALGVATVAIFGPTDELATGPSSKRVAIVREPVDCSPCLLKICPIDHRCMERVSASRVASVALDLLETHKR